VARGGNEAPVIIRKVRKGRAEAHHGGAWKVAYADFVTAMMAFFMLLWLISTPDKERLQGLAEYFSPQAAVASGASSDRPGEGGRTRREQGESPSTSGQPTSEAATAGTARGGTASVPDAALRVLAQELRIALDAVEAPEPRRNVRLETDRDGLRITLMDTPERSMFRPGTSQLNDHARILLADLARRLGKTRARIAIEGHTDAVGGQSDANWRLSGERAHAARAALVASPSWSRSPARSRSSPISRSAPKIAASPSS
jgi:chemotaxis protein MotB